MKKSAYYPFFKKLANPFRIAIIEALIKKEKTVGQLSKELNTEQSKLSHALRELTNCYIVCARRQGKNRIYGLRKTVLPILKLIDKHSRKYCKICIYKRKK